MVSNQSSKSSFQSTSNIIKYHPSGECLRDIYETFSVCPTTYKFLKTNRISYITSNIRKPLLIETSAEIINPCTGFNLTFDYLRDMIYYLVKEGHFTMMDLEHTDFFFADILYEKLADEIEKRNKQQEEENREREKEVMNYQQMQDYQSRMMSGLGNYNFNSLPS